MSDWIYCDDYYPLHIWGESSEVLAWTQLFHTAVSFILQNFGSVILGTKAQFMKASPTLILIYIYIYIHTHTHTQGIRQVMMLALN